MNITRRFFAVLLALSPLAPFSLAPAAPPQSAPRHFLALVGTYTSKTASQGIYAYDFDPETGKLTAKGVAAQTQNPSWIVIHPNGKFVYAVKEAGAQSRVSAFSLEAKSGMLQLLNQLPSEGQDPCYVSIDKKGTSLFVANYTSGTVAVFPIRADGKLGPPTSVVNDAGTLGPNKARQEGPHAHFVEPAERNRFVYVADLGLDKILLYEFDADKGTLTRGAPSSEAAPPGDPFTATLSPGTGPRHVTWSGDGKFMYVVGEMKSTVTVFASDSDEIYRSIQVVSALPAGFTGRNDAAEIALHPNGRFLYTSNRGNDTIAVFAVDPAKGTLHLVANTPTGGKEPRHFAIDPTGQFLLAENQNSDSIVVFRMDGKTGLLEKTGEPVRVPSPVCLQFLPAS